MKKCYYGYRMKAIKFSLMSGIAIFSFADILSASPAKPTEFAHSLINKNELGAINFKIHYRHYLK
jgi:hypothetical protein